MWSVLWMMRVASYVQPPWRRIGGLRRRCVGRGVFRVEAASCRFDAAGSRIYDGVGFDAVGVLA